MMGFTEFVMLMSFFITLPFVVLGLLARRALKDAETKEGVKNAGKTLGKAAVDMLLRKLGGK
jgi:hypothetical protein